MAPLYTGAGPHPATFRGDSLPVAAPTELSPCTPETMAGVEDLVSLPRAHSVTAGRRLQYLTIGWNSVECVVALVAGFMAVFALAALFNALIWGGAFRVTRWGQRHLGQSRDSKPG